MKLEIGQELYTKAGNFVEIIKTDCPEPYCIMAEVQGYDGETNLVNYNINGLFIIGKQGPMDLDLS